MLSLVVHWADVARWLVIAAPLLVGGVVIRLLQRRRMTRPWGRPVRSSKAAALGTVSWAKGPMSVVDLALLLDGPV